MNTVTVELELANPPSNLRDLNFDQPSYDSGSEWSTRVDWWEEIVSVKKPCEAVRVVTTRKR